MVGEGIDLAIRHGRLLDSALTSAKLSETTLIMAASPAYLAAKGVPKRLADLDAHTCVVFARDRERPNWRLKLGQESISCVPTGSFHTRDAEQVRAAVLCGLGVSQAPAWLLSAEIRAGLVQVPLPELEADPLPINLVYPAGRRVPKRVRVLIEYLVSAFRRPDADQLKQVDPERLRKSPRTKR